MQGLPLEVKVEKTKLRIREWYDYWDGNVYISFSGGKDSTVLLNIARQMYPNLVAVFVDTGLEYPEIRDFVKNINNVVWVKPKITFKEVIEKYGYPIINKEQADWLWDHRVGGTEKRRNRIEKVSKKWQFLKDAPFKVSGQCCVKIKKEPIYLYEKETGQKPILGNLATESNKRMKDFVRYGGCNGFKMKRPVSRPLGFWNEQDILNYLIKYEVDYCSVYGDIIEVNGELTTSQEKRTGCMFCAFGVHMEPKPNRFQRMRLSHPKHYNYCINKLGLGEVLDYIGVEY